MNDGPEAVKGYIHSIETAGTVDGPGLRFVIFVSGCPLRCLYCHNPDTRNLKDGRLVSAAELVAEAATYKDFLQRTGGGVTVSGGDPLLQQDFVTEIFRECKKIGLHTALDTSGFLGDKVSDELLDVTDLVLLDIKSFDTESYAKITAAKLAPTLDFARKLAFHEKPTWIRFVLVPGLTDDLLMIEQLAYFVAGLGNIEKVEVLPFHKMGELKWKELGYSYALADTPPPSDELVVKTHEIFRARGLKTV
jgi:pyruvate formate lyase activating enzyme